MFKFGTCVSSEKVPVYLGLPVVPIVLPGANMSLHSYQIGNTPIQTLPVQGTQLNLGHVKPTTMLGSIMDFEAFRQPPSGRVSLNALTMMKRLETSFCCPADMK